MPKQVKVVNPPEIIEDQPPQSPINNQNPDSSGFGLVIWLFDHINARRPVFLSLYQQYDLEVKVSSNHMVLNWLLLVLAMIGDVLIFLIYAQWQLWRSSLVLRISL